MPSKIEKARKVWETKRSKMTAKDWMVVGEALAEGKANNPKTSDFAAWKRANGFTDIPSNYQSDAIWLASETGQRFYFDIVSKKKINHPKVIHQAYRTEQVARLGKPMADAVLEAVNEGCTTEEQISDKLNLEPEDFRRRLPDLKRKGLIQKQDDKWLPCNTEEEVKRQAAAGKVEDNNLNILRLNRAGNALCESISRQPTSEKASDALKKAFKHDTITHFGLQVMDLVDGKLTLEHTSNIGDVMKRDTAEGKNGQVKVSIVVEVIE